jgi:hypothetical protein
MRVLCLSNECSFLRQILKAFADGVDEMGCEDAPQQFLEAARKDPWDAFLIDFDALPAEFSDPVEFVKRLGPEVRLAVMVSSRFADWHAEMEQRGALLLHKPTTIGEIGLVLRKLMGGGQPREMCG